MSITVPQATTHAVAPEAPARAGRIGNESSRATQTAVERTRTEQTRVDRLVRGDTRGSVPRPDGWPVPTGTDPELWRVLSAEERAFFTRAAIGTPTYARAAGGAPMSDALRRGLHLDIRA
jgi:hypothetical protein